MNDNNFVKLGDVAHECRLTWSGEQTNIPIVGLEHLIPGEIELSSWDSNIEHTFSKKFTKGQVLLGRRRVYLKKTVVAPCDGICSGDITVIESTGGILPELLPFVIQNDRFFDYAMQGSAGSLSPRVKWEHLKNYEFSLPSLAEQKVLADKLWAAYHLKESYKKLLAATEEMVKSQFIEMFDFHELNLNSPSKDFESMCLDDTSSATKIPAVEYLQEGKYAVYDQAQEKDIAGYSNTEQGLCRNYPAVLFGDHSRVVKYINEPFFIGADGVKIIRPRKDNLIPEFLYYDLKYHNIPNTGYNRHFKYIKMISLTKASLEEQSRFLSIAHQADKSGFDGRKSQFIEMFKGCKMIPLKKVACFSKASINPIEGVKYTLFSFPAFDNNCIPEIVDGGEIKSSKLKLEENVILYNKLNVRLSRVWNINELSSNNNVCSSEFLPIKVVNKDLITKSFLYRILCSEDVTKKMVACSTGTSNSQKRISPASLLSLYIPIPSMDEQMKFVAIAEQADKSGSVLQHMIAC